MAVGDCSTPGLPASVVGVDSVVVSSMEELVVIVGCVSPAVVIAELDVDALGSGVDSTVVWLGVDVVLGTIVTSTEMEGSVEVVSVVVVDSVVLATEDVDCSGVGSGVGSGAGCGVGSGDADDVEEGVGLVSVDSVVVGPGTIRGRFASVVVVASVVLAGVLVCS